VSVARRHRGSRGRARAAVSPSRDNDASSFSPILIDFIARVPGAIGAVLVDRDGEAVDYAGRVDTYDLKLSGAHWQIVLRETRAVAMHFDLGATRVLAVRGERRSFIVHALPDDYALVLLLGKRAGFTARTRAFAVCERALAEEAGWSTATGSVGWFAAQVVEGRSGRPSRIGANGQEYAVEVVGRLTGLAASEDGWRVRHEQGGELTLIREPGGHWYADEHVDALVGKPRPTSE
jgi:predicted regulator of Ras-like GTPase activity (Roadblock/LC7/MglB family)